MKKLRWILVGLLPLGAFTPLIPAQAPRPESAELPLVRIVLFSSGVGYFQRQGQVDGNARVELQFHVDDINDLLKSLVLQDTGGGQISTVSYDNRDPVDTTLRSFAIDLTANSSLGELLGQVRGEQVEIITGGELARPGQPSTVTGVIVAVEKHREPAGADPARESEQVTLLTREGLQRVALSQVQRIRILRPELEREFRKALEVLARAHDKEKKTVSLSFLGHGKRTVKVGYVVESPIWKTSYRLALENENQAFLQGWAIVENATEEDWDQVSLGLVAGRPISLQMELYEPLYVPRPTVEPDLFAALRPPTYGGNLEEKPARESRERPGGGQPFAPGALGLGGGFGGALGIGGGGMGNAPGEEEPASDAASRLRARGAARLRRQFASGETEAKAMEKTRELDFRRGVANAAVGTELGESFQYQLEQPISLPRKKSALVPIVNQAVEAVRVSIYNASVHAKHPLLGLRFRNTTALHLLQGPLTVFEKQSYAGDARLGDVQPQETRLVSYAVDLGTEVLPEARVAPENLVAVRVQKGIVQTSYKQRQTTSYTVKNRSPHPRLVLIEHPYRADWQLVQPERVAERSREVYRLELKLAAGEVVKQEVVEETTRLGQMTLTDSPEDTVRVVLRANATSPAVKAALKQALDLKTKLVETGQAIQHEEKALQGIENQQVRMRENLARLPQTSEAFKRYLTLFDLQETEIQERRQRLGQLQKRAEGERKNYEQFLRTLTVE